MLLKFCEWFLCWSCWYITHKESWLCGYRQTRDVIDFELIPDFPRTLVPYFSSEACVQFERITDYYALLYYFESRLIVNIHVIICSLIFFNQAFGTMITSIHVYVFPNYIFMNQSNLSLVGNFGKTYMYISIFYFLGIIMDI